MCKCVYWANEKNILIISLNFLNFSSILIILYSSETALILKFNFDPI